MTDLPDYLDGRRLVEFATRGRPEGLAGANVAHIGSGEGGVSVALLESGAHVTAFDEEPTDAETVLVAAKEAGIDLGTSPAYECLPIHAGGLPTTAAFDLVLVTNVVRLRNPVRLFGEIRRVAGRDGSLVVDAHPLFHSAHGGMLPPVAIAPFEHLVMTASALAEQVRSRIDNPAYAEALLDRFGRLNRLTLEGLQQAVIAAGFRIDTVHLRSDPADLPPEMQYRSLTDVAVSGITLAASAWR